MSLRANDNKPAKMISPTTYCSSYTQNCSDGSMQRLIMIHEYDKCCNVLAVLDEAKLSDEAAFH